jgi:flagellar motor switch protein FliG
VAASAAAATAPVKSGGSALRLRGPDKVATLLLAMGRPIAGKLLTHFDPDEIRMVTRAAADLRPISTSELETIIEEFAYKFASGPSILGTVGELEKLLANVLPPEQVADIMSDVLGNTNRTIWDRISSVPEGLLAGYLLKEHPQIAALILSKVKPACAAKVMAQIPPNTCNNLMRRMLSFKPIAEEAMRIVDKTLHEDFMLNFSRNMGADTYTRLADIINKMERSHMEETLKSLAETRPKAAEVLKGLLFTFDDIATITPRARMAIFDRVPTEKVVIALKGTSPVFRELILSALATRTRRLVEHELATGDPAPQREVLEARRTITDLALEMAGQGDIELNPDQDDEAVYR